jgi:error-prone DNA polymerase
MKHPKTYSLPACPSSSSSPSPSRTSSSTPEPAAGAGGAASSARLKKPPPENLPAVAVYSSDRGLFTPVPRAEFIELLGRSNFSFLQGASHPEEMVMQAKTIGYKGLAISDVNGLYGVVRGYQAAEKPSLFDADQLSFAEPDGTPKEAFHYLCGAEVTPYDASPLVLLPMTKEGYVSLCKLLTSSKRRAPKGHIVMSLSHVLEANEDLIAIPLPPWKESELKKLQDAFQDRIYLPVCKDFSWESVRHYQQAMEFEKTLGILPFATNRPLFHEPGRKPLHDVLTCILHKTTLTEASTRLTLNRERYLKAPTELAKLFRERPELLTRTLEIAARVEFSLGELKYKYPQEHLPAGMNATEYLRKLVTEGVLWRYGFGPRGAGGANPGASQDAGAAAAAAAKVWNQVDHELETIAEMEYEDYFLTLSDICRFAREVGILHQGRGSAANSIVCFALGLTSVDPIKLGLLFERFMSKERGEPPDIDIDFEHERREEVIQYIYTKYGERRAAMVCTVITYRSRMAIREIAKVMGIPIQKIGALIKFMGREGISRLVDIAVERGIAAQRERRAPGGCPPLGGPAQSRAAGRAAAPDAWSNYAGGPGHKPAFDQGSRVELKPAENPDGAGAASATSRSSFGGEGGGRSVEGKAALSAAEANIDLAQFGLDEIKFQKLLQLALEMQGFPRHLGIHSGGFVISHESIVDIVPVEAATMNGRFVIQWNKDDINTLGLMKIDILALGMLTAVQKALKLLREHKGIDWNLAQVPADCPGTYKMIQKADTVGVFQIESRAQMSLLPRLKPANYYDLVIEVAIVRPGPIQGGMVHPYLKRRAGREKVTYAHPLLEPILSKTLGLPLFQEQIMQIAVAVAGFTPGEADELRRVVSSAWKKKAVMHGLHQRVVNGMLSNGISREYAEQIYKTIEGFSSYGFPESHAASFALITYISCYFKHHFPDVFACALLNSQPMGFYAPRQLIADAQRHGVHFYPLDVQRSSWDYTLQTPPAPAVARTNSAGLRMAAVKAPTSEALTQRHTVAAEPVNMVTRRHAAVEFAVQVGFCSIYGVREEHVARITQERVARGLFRDLSDLVRRAQVPRATLIRLAGADALKCFGLTPRQALWAIQGMSFDPQSLFFGANVALDGERLESESAILPVENSWENVQREYRTKGFAIDSHPLAVLRPQLLRSSTPYTTALQLEGLRNSASVRVAGLMSLLQKPPTAKGMCFISLEDETGLMNIVITPDIYQKVRLVLTQSPLLEVVGKLENREGVRNIKAHDVRPMRNPGK